MWWYGGMGWGGWVLMTLTTVAFLGLLAVAVVAVWRAVDRGGRTGAGEATAQQLLDERFARGEIDEDEYRRRRELLRSGR